MVALLGCSVSRLVRWISRPTSTCISRTASCSLRRVEGFWSCSIGSRRRTWSGASRRRAESRSGTTRGHIRPSRCAEVGGIETLSYAVCIVLGFLLRVGKNLMGGLDSLKLVFDLGFFSRIAVRMVFEG